MQLAEERQMKMCRTRKQAQLAVGTGLAIFVDTNTRIFENMVQVGVENFKQVICVLIIYILRNTTENQPFILHSKRFSITHHE